MIEQKLRKALKEVKPSEAQESITAAENVEMLISSLNTNIIESEIFSLNASVTSAAQRLIDALEDVLDEIEV